MYPLTDTILLLPELAKHWRRHFPEQPPEHEILDALLQAYWRGQLLLCNVDGELVGHQQLLGMVNAAAPHSRVLIYEDPTHPPPIKQELPDGGLIVSLVHRICLPPRPPDWSDDVISEACSTLAASRFEDYSLAAQAAFTSLCASRDAFEALCIDRGYERPSFWFGRNSSDKTPRSFGGRPSVMRHIIAEMRRRALSGSLEPTLRREAEALCAWAKKEVPETKQIPTARAIENGVRDVYWELRGRLLPGHKT